MDNNLDANYVCDAYTLTECYFPSLKFLEIYNLIDKDKDIIIHQ